MLLSHTRRASGDCFLLPPHCGDVDYREKKSKPYRRHHTKTCFSETVDDSGREIRNLDAPQDAIPGIGGQHIPISGHNHCGQQSHSNPAQVCIHLQIAIVGFLDTRLKAPHGGESVTHPEGLKPGPKECPWLTELKYDSPDIG